MGLFDFFKDKKKAGAESDKVYLFKEEEEADVKVHNKKDDAEELDVQDGETFVVEIPSDEDEEEEAVETEKEEAVETEKEDSDQKEDSQPKEVQAVEDPKVYMLYDEQEADYTEEDVQIVVEEAPEEICDDTEVAEDEEDTEEKKTSFFNKMKNGLIKTRDNLFSNIDSVLSVFKKIDEEFYEELEEALIMADLGVETSGNIIEILRERVKAEGITDTENVKELLAEIIAEMLMEDSDGFTTPSPTIILVIGVNGVGKTTSIGKLANYYKSQGKKVLLAAGDTFRAAAIDQLEVWGKRTGVDVIRQQENSDPAAVIFDAVKAAKARGIDMLICDTAGRLHNKKNLMEELKKISRIIDKEFPEAHKEVLLVLDGTTGQNALQQAKLFMDVADISGIILTKIDGTAKGGIVVSIKNTLDIPVRFIGVGESVDDLQPFDASSFAKALFSEN